MGRRGQARADQLRGGESVLCQGAARHGIGRREAADQDEVRHPSRSGWRRHMKAKLDKVRTQPSEELINRVIELNESLFRLKFKKALGDIDTVKQIRVQKKELARLKTILRGRALGVEK